MKFRKVKNIFLVHRDLKCLFYHKVASQNIVSSLPDNQEKRSKYGKVMLSVSTRSSFIPLVTLGFGYISVPSELASVLFGIHLDFRRTAGNLEKMILSSMRVCLTKRNAHIDSEAFGPWEE